MPTLRKTDRRTLAIIGGLYASQRRIAARVSRLHPTRPGDIVDEAVERGISHVAVDLWLGTLSLAAYDDPHAAARKRAVTRARNVLDLIATQGRNDAVALAGLGDHHADPPGARALLVAAAVDGMRERVQEVAWLVAEGSVYQAARTIGCDERTIHRHLQYVRVHVADTLGDPEPLRAHRARAAAMSRRQYQRRMGL